MRFCNVRRPRCAHLAPGITLLIWSLSGCSATHLYRPQNHQLATLASATFDEANLSEGLDEERALLEELLEREVEVVHRHTVARRDAHLRNIIGGSDSTTSWGSLDALMSRLDRIAGGSDSVIVVAAISLPEFLNGLQRRLDLYLAAKEAGDPILTCSHGMVDRETDDVSATAAIVFRQYQQDCRRYLEASDVIAISEIGDVNDSIRLVSEQYALLRNDLRRASSEYADARGAYTEAIQLGDRGALQSLAQSLKESLDKSAQPLDSVSQRIDATLSQLGFGDLTKARALQKIEEQRASVNAILEAIHDAGTDISVEPESETQLHLRIASFLPSLDPRISTLQFPQVSGLLLESERLRLARDAVPCVGR
jgi:hypothetical protein